MPKGRGRFADLTDHLRDELEVGGVVLIVMDKSCGSVLDVSLNEDIHILEVIQTLHRMADTLEEHYQQRISGDYFEQN